MKTAALIASLALAPATRPRRPRRARAAVDGTGSEAADHGRQLEDESHELEDARELAKSVAAAAGSSAAEGIVFPPYPFIGPVGEIIKDTQTQPRLPINLLRGQGRLHRCGQRVDGQVA